MKRTKLKIAPSRPLSLALALATLPSIAVAQPVPETETATTTPMPEEGGPMKRAPMPLGGVEDGMERASPPGGGVDDGIPRADMPTVSESPYGEPAEEKKKSEHRPKERDEPEEIVGVERYDESTIEAEPGLTVNWTGYLRVIAEAIENDSRSPFIGRNDGFKLGNARLGIKVGKGSLFAFVQIDAAVGERESFNDPNAQFTVRPRDAYLRYEASDFVHVSAGRFKAPHDISELESTAKRPFIDQAVESRGVLPTQGNEVVGMSQDRQLGIMLHRYRIGLSEDGFDLGYALALTNGRTFDLALNDNDRPAAFARLSAFYADMLRVNVAGFSDSRTVGELPNLFDEEAQGVEASLVFALAGLEIEAQLLYQNTEFETSGQDDVNALGWHGQWVYHRWNAFVGYRFGWYDPNLDDIDDSDRVMEHTLGLGYQLERFPLKLVLNGTIAQEQQGRKVDNNRLALLSQFTF